MSMAGSIFKMNLNGLWRVMRKKIPGTTTPAYKKTVKVNVAACHTPLMAATRKATKKQAQSDTMYSGNSLKEKPVSSSSTAVINYCN